MLWPFLSWADEPVEGKVGCHDIVEFNGDESGLPE
jgi:hypothetical protein